MYHIGTPFFVYFTIKNIELKYVIRCAPYWNLYTIEVRKRKPNDSDNLNDGELYATIKTKKPELEAVMEWLESEYS